MFFAGFLLFSSVFSRGYGASYTLQQAEAARKVMNRCDPAVGISDGCDAVMVSAIRGHSSVLERLHPRAMVLGRGFRHDVQYLMDALHKASQKRMELFGEPMTGEDLAAEAARQLHSATVTGSRPFACELLIVGCTEGSCGRPEVTLHHVGLDGVATAVRAAAIGRNPGAFVDIDKCNTCAAVPSV